MIEFGHGQNTPFRVTSLAGFTRVFITGGQVPSQLISHPAGSAQLGLVLGEPCQLESLGVARPWSITCFATANSSVLIEDVFCARTLMTPLSPVMIGLLS